MAISKEPDVDAAARPRPSGDPMTPENAAPRPGPARRSGAISGAPLEPEAAAPRASGDAMDNEQPSNVVAPVINGPSGDPGIKPIPTK